MSKLKNRPSPNVHVIMHLHVVFRPIYIDIDCNLAGAKDRDSLQFHQILRVTASKLASETQNR